MIRAVDACVHCGFCLPTCPTYVVLGEEMNSPRGRIILMKETLEGRLKANETKPYIDCCLGCLACETSCPSGVRYGELLTPFRAWAEPQRQRGAMDRLRRRILLATLPHPGRFRLAASAGRLGPAAAGPDAGGAAADARSGPGEAAARIPAARDFPGQGARAAPRVALLAGCAQQVLAPGINRATLRVLAANGVEVVIPRGQACCGALAMHVGEEKSARATARRNLAAFPKDVDAILTNASGCGSGLREYGLLFEGRPEAARAQAFVALTADICTFLDQLGLIAPAGRAAAPAHQGRLPRRLPSRPRPEGARGAAAPARPDPGARTGRTGRVGAMLRLRRHL